jgi:diphthine synthase
MGGLIFVGLGLTGLQDITLRGLDAVRSADIVCAEFYTSRLIGADIKDMEALVGKPIRILSREDVETRADDVLKEAKTKLVALLVAGDPMSATTHHDLRERAAELKIPTRIFPGVSIFTTAPAMAGLQIYKFGRTTTMPFEHGNYLAESPYEVIRDNKNRGLHTLVLLDIDAQADRFMSVAQAVTLLMKVEERRKEGVIKADTMIVGLARLGSPDQRVLYANAGSWPSIDLGPPLHCLIVPGSLHFMEETGLARMRGAGGPTTHAALQPYAGLSAGAGQAGAPRSV